MPVVEEEQRLDMLKCLGLSAPLIRQSAGEQVDPLFWFRCQGPPYFSYNGADCPNGPLFAPLWDCCDTVTGVWSRNGQLEFIEFSIEDDPVQVYVLAHTEQGLWTTVFMNMMYEDRDDLPREAFRNAARSVGFRFLNRLVESYHSEVHTTSQSHDEFLRRLVAMIDAESVQS